MKTEPAYPEVELEPSHASFINTVRRAEVMFAEYGVSYPVSGDATALAHLAEFTRTAIHLERAAAAADRLALAYADTHGVAMVSEADGYHLDLRPSA